MFNYLNSYLKIKWFYQDKNVKTKMDTYYPLFFALLFFLVYFIAYLLGFKECQFLFESEGFKNLVNLFIALPGFYIAALAACLTISNSNFIYSNSNNNLKGIINGGQVDIPIRTLFTSAFSYLTFLSFIFLILYTISTYLYSNAYFPVDEKIYFFLKNFLNSLIIFIFLRVFFITIVCVSYLGNRAHR